MPQIDALPAMTESPAPDDVLPLHNESSGDTEKVRVDDLVGSPALGWIADSNTWTYVSGTGTITGVFKISGVDATGYLEAGMRIKLTQTQVKYGIITKVAFSTDTTVTCLMAATAGVVDNSGITNTTISSPAFSRAKIPFGFSLDPAKWTVTASNSTQRSTTSTSYATLTDAITVPIGAWSLEIQIVGQMNTPSSTLAVIGYITLSSDGSTETNAKTTIVLGSKSPTSAITSVESQLTSREDINIADATTYTAIGKTSSGTIYIRGDDKPSVYRAICSYL